MIHSPSPIVLRAKRKPSPRNVQIYEAVRLTGERQADVAARHGLSQRRVSAICQQVDQWQRWASTAPNFEELQAQERRTALLQARHRCEKLLLAALKQAVRKQERLVSEVRRVVGGQEVVERTVRELPINPGWPKFAGSTSRDILRFTEQLGPDVEPSQTLAEVDALLAALGAEEERESGSGGAGETSLAANDSSKPDEGANYSVDLSRGDDVLWFCNESLRRRRPSESTSIYKYFAEPKPACSAVVRQHLLEPIAMISVSPPVAPENSVFAAFVGLDWADQKHDLVLYDPARRKARTPPVDAYAEAIDEWACGLRQRFGGRPIAVCFEQSRGGIAYALLKYDFLVLFPLPPARLASYRESFSNSGAKDDPTDAALLVDYLLRHRDQLRVWQPDTPATRELQLLAEARRDAVDQRTRLSNQLTAVLKRYFPQAVVLVGHDVDTPAGLRLPQPSGPPWPPSRLPRRPRSASSTMPTTPATRSGSSSGWSW